ncbi:MAG: hypothetical protein KAI47_13220 [Deltaproteobacteria bacterium]|nr:hypothetical protein [Deltaproteobacteria bacterium]
MGLWGLGFICLIAATACGEVPVVQDTTRLGDTLDRDGPYVVRVVVGHPEAVDTATLVAYLGSEGKLPIAMSEVRRGLFEASIPGQPAFTQVRYIIEVSGGGETVTDPPSAVGTQDGYRFWVLGSPCKGSEDCLPGERCDDSHVCRARGGPCLHDVDCGRGFRCEASRCRLNARRCSSDAGCLFGEVCDVLLGACVPRPGCEGGTTCPLDFVCEADVCRRRCAGDADCLPGERCDVKSICRVPKGCTGTADCGDGLACDPLLHLCRAQGAGSCGGCGADIDCGGPNDHCLVLKEGLRCGRDCSLVSCPPAYTCDSTYVLPQCVPVTGQCSP